MFMATMPRAQNMTWECVSDPSAGSPTETLLRLLPHPSDDNP